MSTSIVITSAQNPGIKYLLKLMDKPAERRKENLVVIEGLRECERAVKAGWKLKEIFWCRNRMEEEELDSLLNSNNGNVEVIEVNEYVFEKIAIRDSSHGIVAVAEAKKNSFDEIKKIKSPFFLVLEGVEKPGNLGAILRTANAACVDAIIVCDPKTDIYNPNVIRSSTGAIFSLPVVQTNSEECLSFLQSMKIKIGSAFIDGNKTYYDCDWKGSIAMIFGTEDKGLSDFWSEHCDEKVNIPMKGIVDSLNLSVSVGIMVFEAARQRGSL